MVPFHLRATCSVADAAKFTGLGRTTLFKLIREGLIGSKLVKTGDCNRGIRLIFVPSLLEYVGATDFEKLDAMSRAAARRSLDIGDIAA